MNSPLVSVIIPVFNAEEYIDDCLNSLLKQTYSNIEIIACDDASTDSSYEKLMKYSKVDNRIKVFRNNLNIFAAATRNKCIFESNGEYLVLQDIDDVSEKNRISILVETITNENVDFVSSGLYEFENNIDMKSKVLYPKLSHPNKDDFLMGLPFYHATTLFKRECLISVNGYRIAKETRRGQDYDLFMRLYSIGYRGINVKDILYGYRVNGETIKRRKFRYRLDECIIRFKGFKKLGLFPKGYFFVLKPIIAHIHQVFFTRRSWK